LTRRLHDQAGTHNLPAFQTGNILRHESPDGCELFLQYVSCDDGPVSLLI
jgi:hypothetical protein